MVIDASIKVKYYKCFGEEEQGFEKIYPINILIGKNNSGKSSLIDLIEFTFNPKGGLLNPANGFTTCTVDFKLDSEIIKVVGTNYANSQSSTDYNGWTEHIKTHISNYGKTESIKLTILKDGEFNFITDLQACFGQFAGEFRFYLYNHFKRTFARINADRDIEKETFQIKEVLHQNGKGATNIIWRYLSIQGYDQNVIKEELLGCLNEITKPDIEFSDISIQEEANDQNRQGSYGEIYFKYKNGTWVALSKMGSGIKTIILVLLNLIVTPKLTHNEKKNFVFGFEELENNLHPSVQRRLFSFISDYAEKNGSYFFITTHSNIVIDLFSHNPNAQLIHVENRENLGKHALAKSVSSNFDQRYILKDLDFKTSDLLLSNGIIWVEGPSDAIYIEMLLNLYKGEKQLFSNYNYCIQSLSTAIWKYAGFSDFNWDNIDSQELENKIIKLASLNHNHLIVLDKDENYEDKRPSEWQIFVNKTGQNKARLIYESMNFANNDEINLENNYGESKDGRLLFWVNDGTFETYLEYFIKNKGKDFDKYFSKHKTLKFFEKKRTAPNHTKSKVELAAEIAQFVSNSNCSLSDIAPLDSNLFKKIEKLAKTIKSWNEIYR